MEQVTDELLQRMVKVIVAEANPEQIILFGSYARGNATADSDVDFVIVESGSFGEGKDRRLEAARLWRALADFDVPKDLLLYSSDEVEYWRDSVNHVLSLSLREGKVLYERP